MSDLLLSEGASIKAKEADHFAFLISDVVIPDGTSRLDAVASLADAGIYTSEDDLVYGMDESDSRNERMLIKAVGHLGDSNHRWNEGALSQLAAAWPCSRTTQIELSTFGAYSFTAGGQTMANVAIMPFGGALNIEVAYVAGVHMLSNLFTAERMELVTRTLLFPTIDAIVRGLKEPELEWFTKHDKLATDATLPAAEREAHRQRATRSCSKIDTMEALLAAPGEMF